MECRKRDAWLDGLRAVAVLLVLGRHVPLSPESTGWLTTWVRGGWVGVDLFFVLSGFLVSGLLFRAHQERGELDVRRFLVRRGLRLYPAFYALLISTALLAHWLPFPKRNPGAYLAEMLFVQNYAGGVWNHTWSLAVEEHFYLLLPLLLAGLLHWRRGNTDPFRPLMPLTLAVMVGLALVRGVQGWLVPFDRRAHLFATHLRLDSLLAGVLLAYGYHYHRAAFERCFSGRRWLWLSIGAACFVPAFVLPLDESWFIHTLGLTLLALGSMALIAGGVGAAPLVARSLAPLGAVSYSIYLWHMPVLVWAMPLGERLLGFRLAGPARLGVYLGASILVGAVMAWVTERPILRLRDRWWPVSARREPGARTPLILGTRHGLAGARAINSLTIAPRAD